MLPKNVNLPLKAVTERLESCRAVRWAIDTHGSRLVRELGQAFEPHLTEGQVLPFETQLDLFGEKLNLSLDDVVTTDRVYRDQKARESISRRRRDELFGSATEDLIELRQAFSGFYSDDKLGEFGFARRTPQLPSDLVEQASHLVARLSDSSLDLSGSRYESLQLNAATMVQKLVASVGALRVAIDDLAREERRTEALKLAKDDALGRYNQSFLWIARTVESLCRLAGLDEVARRVRPSRRRPGLTARRSEPADDAPDASDAQGPADADGVSDQTPTAANEPDTAEAA